MPSAARRDVELCGDRRDQGFVTLLAPGVTGSLLTQELSQDKLSSLPNEGSGQNVPKSPISRDPPVVCGHFYGVTSAQVSLWGVAVCVAMGQRGL